MPSLFSAPLQIRPERPADAVAISVVTAAAFKDASHSSGSEADIVDRLRSMGALAVSIVAVESGEIVGHAAFSAVTIAAAQGAWYGLGPVSVRPDRQGRGVGQALVRAGLDQLVSLGAAGCVVLGDPRYYRRFGFESDQKLTYGGAPPPYFQRLILKGPPPAGEVAYHPSFQA